MAFHKSPRRVAWETFVKTIKEDPVIGREVKTIRTWQGDTRSDGKATTRQYPYLLLEAHSTESEWLDTASMSADFEVDVTMMMNGVDPSDLMDFWYAIVRALYPTDPQEQARIEQRHYLVGIRGISFEIPAFGVVEEAEMGGTILQANGKIRLTYDEQLKGF